VSSNLDLGRSIYADWERGDFSHVEWAHPEIEYVVMDGPSPGRWEGLAQMAEFVRDFLSVMKEWRDEAEDYHELPDGRVLVLDQLSGRGSTSGLEVRQTRGAHLFVIDHGKVTSLLSYIDRDRALADLGLEK
jgi:ketosteroid isomerase-like protein